MLWCESRAISLDRPNEFWTFVQVGLVFEHEFPLESLESSRSSRSSRSWVYARRDPRGHRDYRAPGRTPYPSGRNGAEIKPSGGKPIQSEAVGRGDDQLFDGQQGSIALGGQ